MDDITLDNLDLIRSHLVIVRKDVIDAVGKARGPNETLAINLAVRALQDAVQALDIVLEPNTPRPPAKYRVVNVSPTSPEMAEGLNSGTDA